MQDPEIFVVVELLPVGRGKLPPKDPELPPSRGHHSCLQDKEELDQSRIPNLHTTPPVKHMAPKLREQQQLSGAEGRIWIKRCSWFSSPSLEQGKAGQGKGIFPEEVGSSKFPRTHPGINVTKIVQLPLFKTKEKKENIKTPPQ